MSVLDMSFRPVSRPISKTIASFGIICHRFRVDYDLRRVVPEFLLVQRKDTIAFVEYMRGRYDASDERYVSTLLEGMTKEEQRRLPELSFSEMWSQMWGGQRPPRRVAAEYSAAATKHEALLSAGKVTYDPLRQQLPELEWGFPKGRKYIGEAEGECACREFSEETGVPAGSLYIYSCTPFEETFEGGNGLWYRHKYFLCRLGAPRSSAETQPVPGSHQAREISNVAWFSPEQAKVKFKAHASRCSIVEKATEALCAMYPGGDIL